MRCFRRGAAALFGVTAVAAVAGAALTAWYAAHDDARLALLDRESGRVFAWWFLGAHRASQERDFSAQFTTTPAGFTLTPTQIGGAAPPGLPDRPGKRATATFGLIDDGAGVPMAFGVLEPELASSSPAIRAGALAAGMADLAESGASVSPMTARLPAIAAVLGRPVPAGALYATADFGVRYDEAALYRRSQPGRPWLNRMSTDLDLAGDPAATPPVPNRRIVDAGAVSATSTTVSGGVTATTASTARGAASAASVSAATLRPEVLDVRADLVVSRRLTARRVWTTGNLAAASVAATGRLSAGRMTARGAATAASLTAGGPTAVSGALQTDSVTSGSVSAPLLASSGNLALGAGLSAPHAAISGTLTVQSCDGC